MQTTPHQRMKIGIVLDISEGSLDGRTPTFRDLREMALVAEQVGLDSIWLADHLIYRFPNGAESAPWEALTMLSALAAVTTHITLGTLVVCTSFRPPAMLAKMADALDEVSGGRFILGLGAGWHQPEYEAFGYPFDHLASRFDEALQILRSLEPQYPHNVLFAVEDGNLLRAKGENQQAEAVYRRVGQDGRNGKYAGLNYEIAAVALGDLLRGQKNYAGAAAAYEQVGELSKSDPETTQRAAVGAGEMYDLMHKRELALKKYQAVIAVDSGSHLSDVARKRIKEPYSGS